MSKPAIRLLATLSLTFFFFACGNEHPTVSDRMPSFRLPTGQGDSLSSSAYQGQVLLIAFWATWCPPCVMEIPMLKTLQQEFAPEGFHVIGINLDENAGKVLPQARARHQFNYPVAIGNASTVEAFGNFSSLPTTFLVDRQGRIREMFTGLHAYDELAGKIRSVLADTVNTNEPGPK